MKWLKIFLNFNRPKPIVSPIQIREAALLKMLESSMWALDKGSKTHQEAIKMREKLKVRIKTGTFRLM